MAPTRPAQGWIRQFHKPHAPQNPALLIFPHAGSGASYYRALSQSLSESFDVIIFQYPGRQDRSHEPALPTLRAIAEGAFEEFLASERHRDAPIMTFGHSMGALVSFEFVQIAEARGIEVRQMTVSAAVAPWLAEAKPAHPTEDEELLNQLASLEGTDPAVFANREILRLALPAVKGDYQAFDSYSCGDDIKVSAPIHALGGDKDPEITIRDLQGWGRHTDDLRLTMFSGGHFYLKEHADAVVRLLAAPIHSEPARR